MQPDKENSQTITIYKEDLPAKTWEAYCMGFAINASDQNVKGFTCTVTAVNAVYKTGSGD